LTLARAAAAVEAVQQGWQPRTPGAGLDAERVQDFLAGQYAVLGFFAGIRAGGVGLGGG